MAPTPRNTLPSFCRQRAVAAAAGVERRNDQECAGEDHRRPSWPSRPCAKASASDTRRPPRSERGRSRARARAPPCRRRRARASTTPDRASARRVRCTAISARRVGRLPVPNESPVLWADRRGSACLAHRENARRRAARPIRPWRRRRAAWLGGPRLRGLVLAASRVFAARFSESSWRVLGVVRVSPSAEPAGVLFGFLADAGAAEDAAFEVAFFGRREALRSLIPAAAFRRGAPPLR